MKILTFLSILIKITWCEYDKRVITTLKYSKYHVKPTIVNGQPAARGQMPYLVSINEPVRTISKDKLVWLSLCGGSIISKSKVLTAAHCFEGNNFYYRTHPGIVRLVAGNLKSKMIHSGATETNNQAQWRKIKRLILHEDFAFPENDIAMVYVNEPWEFNDYVNYVVTATRTTDYPRTCYSAGFGTTGPSLRDTPPVLMQARIDVMSRWQCSALWQMEMGTFICTDSAVTDVGVGDSGGPLACKYTLDPAEEMNRDLLVGVVSGKNYDKTSLFTRVSLYSDWIEDPQTSSGFSLNKKLVPAIITFLIIRYLLFH